MSTCTYVAAKKRGDLLTALRSVCAAGLTVHAGDLLGGWSRPGVICPQPRRDRVGGPRPGWRQCSVIDGSGTAVPVAPPSTGRPP